MAKRPSPNPWASPAYWRGRDSYETLAARQGHAVSAARRARSRRRRHAGHGGQRRPLWYHQTALVAATDAPPIRREAWATLQEWAVCSSIFVVGRGVKAGLPGSMPRGTLNERSERVDNLRRSSGRRTAYICAASSAAALAVPQPQRCRLAQAIMEKTATAAQSRRRPRGVHALLLTCPLHRARLAAPLAVARKLQSSGHGAGTQPFVPGAMRFIYEACE